MNPQQLIMLMLAVLLAACDGGAPASAPKTGSWELPVVVVAAGAPVDYTAVGSVAAEARIEVASRLSGYLRELRVREGDFVRRGQLLARVDAPDVDGAIGQARALKATADAAERDAYVDADRYALLYSKGMVSESEMRKFRLKLDTARETLSQAKAALDSAEAQRGYATITSPQDGAVVAVLRRPGDLVVPGGPILLVESTQELVFETAVTEKQIGALRVGRRLRCALMVSRRPFPGESSASCGLPTPLRAPIQSRSHCPQRRDCCQVCSVVPFSVRQKRLCGHTQNPAGGACRTSWRVRGRCRGYSEISLVAHRPRMARPG